MLLLFFICFSWELKLIYPEYYTTFIYNDKIKTESSENVNMIEIWTRKHNKEFIEVHNRIMSIQNEGNFVKIDDGFTNYKIFNCNHTEDIHPEITHFTVRESETLTGIKKADIAKDGCYLSEVLLKINTNIS